MGNSSVYIPLKKKRDFENLRNSGVVIHVTHWLMVVCLRNSVSENRVGWTLPKFVGNAVVRNRLRRWGRERVKVWDFAEFPKSLDLNFVFKKRAAGFYKTLDREEFGIAFSRAFEKVKNRYERFD